MKRKLFSYMKGVRKEIQGKEGRKGGVLADKRKRGFLLSRAAGA